MNYKREPLQNTDVVNLYINANNRLRHVHDALWKEEAHYTWLLYIIAGGALWSLTIDLDDCWGDIISIVLSIIGIVFSVIAFLVIARETKLLDESKVICKKYRKQLGIQGIEKSIDIKRPRITTWFKVTMLIPIAIYLAIILASVVS